MKATVTFLCLIGGSVADLQPPLVGENLATYRPGKLHSAVQPDLDVENWFLTQDEMDHATGGFDRTSLGIALSSHGNLVHAYVTGEDYFASLFRDVELTSSGDFIYMTGWLTRNDTILMPQTAESAAATNIGEVWSNAISRNVSSLSLLWRNLLPRNLDLENDFKNTVATAGERAGMGDRARVIIDGRAPLPSGSHHQKSIVVKRQGEAVGYVGGIDLADERWDTPDHCCAQDPPCAACEAVKRQPGYGEACTGWQDVHTKVRGPVVRDIAGNFIARWNDDEVPSNAKPKEEVPPKITAMDASEVAASGVGTHSVQLLRTYVCSYQRLCQHGCFTNNAPFGETSHRDALIKAFSKAENFIYIEDQYFVYEKDLHVALLDAVRRGVQLIVLTQEQRGTPGYETFQHGMVTPLREACADCVHAFIRSDGVYVHTKVVIVDDVYMTVGSNNINFRSATYDTELSIATVDSLHITSADSVKVAKLAWNTRVRLWAVQSEMTVAEMAALTLRDAVAQWYMRAKEGAHIVQFFPEEKKVEWAIEAAVDPDGTCSKPQTEVESPPDQDV